MVPILFQVVDPCREKILILFEPRCRRPPKGKTGAASVHHPDEVHLHVLVYWYYFDPRTADRFLEAAEPIAKYAIFNTRKGVDIL